MKFLYGPMEETFEGGPFRMPFPGPPSFPGGPGGPWEHDVFFRRVRRPRAGRGDVRAAILLLLEEEPRNGYQVMQQLEERSGGMWRPSPGSVYPALQLLADEGLVQGEAKDGGNVFSLTDAGRQHVEEHRERLGTPWQPRGGRPPEEVIELRRLVGQIFDAVDQVGRAGNAGEIEAATKLLADTRRSLYRILAEESAGPAED